MIASQSLAAMLIAYLGRSRLWLNLTEFKLSMNPKVS